MTPSEAVALLTEAGIDNPRYDAHEIFMRIGGFNRFELLSNPDTQNEDVISGITRRAKREPLQYIIGEVGFFRETYKVTPDCLIPRSDTEILVEYAVEHIPKGENFIDLCTGSGCIAISTLKNTENTTAVALDISDGALALAKENAERNGVASRLTLLHRDVLTSEEDGEFYAVLSNPPYVKEEAYLALEPEIFFEPKNAFTADNSGLAFYERITSVYKSKLKSGGFIAFEIGFDEAEQIKQIAEQNGMTAQIIFDYSKNPRVAILKKTR